MKFLLSLLTAVMLLQFSGADAANLNFGKNEARAKRAIQIGVWELGIPVSHRIDEYGDHIVSVEDHMMEEFKEAIGEVSFRKHEVVPGSFAVDNIVMPGGHIRSILKYNQLARQSHRSSGCYLYYFGNEMIGEF